MLSLTQQDRYVVMCPSCRCITQLPDSGVVGLPTAFHINNILELQATLEKGMKCKMLKVTAS